MRPFNRPIFFLAGGVLAAAASVAGDDVYVSPDVATTLDDETFLQDTIVSHVESRAPQFMNEATLPGGANVDGLHKLDAPGSWLVSPDGTVELGPGAVAGPNDVLRLVEGAATLFFDGSCVSPAIPLGTDIEALSVLGTDDGTLVVAFDVAVELGASSVPPGVIASFTRSGEGACAWSYAGPFADLRSTSMFPTGARITGLDADEGTLRVAFDVPVDLAPTSGPETLLPGQVARLDIEAGTWDLATDLQGDGPAGWPVSSQIDGLSGEANPGGFDVMSGFDGQIRMDRPSVDTAMIECPSGCSSGAQRFGVYEGSLDVLRSTGVYDHAQVGCFNTCPGAAAVALGEGNRYFLVVPNDGTNEGSFGQSLTRVPIESGTGSAVHWSNPGEVTHIQAAGSGGDSGQGDAVEIVRERPRPESQSARCAQSQIVSTCPAS